MAANYSVIIPARYQSSRFPGKVLADIAGKPMLQHVYERASRTSANSIIIATDDEKVKAVAAGFCDHIVMTDQNHLCGTERIAEVVAKLAIADDEIIVNLQADEPLIDPQLIDQVATVLSEATGINMATLYEPIATAADIFNPSVVKVLLDKNDLAIYFSRAPIAWDQKNARQGLVDKQWLEYYNRHIGLYAYRAGFIRQYVNWQSCPLERIESLEQLRVLWNGHKIKLAKAKVKSFPGIDTPEDLQRTLNFISANLEIQQQTTTEA